MASYPDQNKISAMYSTHGEDIQNKRLLSDNKVRSSVHQAMYQSVIDRTPRFASLVDVGCGDGTLTYLLASRGIHTLGVDISEPNIEMAKSRYSLKGVMSTPHSLGNLEFQVADATNTQLPSGNFDVVVSHHVLEHLSSFDQGLRELKRLSSGTIIIAIPTCLSPLSWAQLGGGTYWVHGKFGFLRLLYGLGRVLLAFLNGAIGVDERSYSGLGDDAPHIFFFPKRVMRTLECENWICTEYSPQVRGIPWVPWSIHPGGKARNPWGLGTIFVLKKIA